MLFVNDKEGWQKLQLGADPPLGKGGEGVVAATKYPSGYAVKIYKSPPSAEKIAKLHAMISMFDSQLNEVCAWPLRVVVDQHGQTRGMLMSKVEDHREIHDVYGPTGRRKYFPDFHWSKLLFIAALLAHTFSLLHRRGCIIGDVNPKGFLVSREGKIKLVDCDSFQVTHKGQTYHCDVGFAEYLAPELRGKSLEGETRTENQDNFALAVLLFQIFFMGFHPASGRLRSGKEPRFQDRIRDLEFFHIDSGRRVIPPPSAPPFNIIGDELMKLFQTAFLPKTVSARWRFVSRPSAQEWLQAIERLRKTIRQCDRQAMHAYPKFLRRCPWCDLARSVEGVRHFEPIAAPPAPQRRRWF